MIAYSKKKQKMGESDDDIVQRDVKKKRMKNMLAPRNSSLDLWQCKPYNNMSQEIRNFLHFNVSINNRIPKDSPCWNSTPAWKLCETYSYHCKDISKMQADNVTKYLNHSAAVARDRYVIEDPDTVIQTKSVIKNQIFHMKHANIVTITVQSDSESSSDASSVPYGGPTEDHHQKNSSI